jgi:hypothetical protein
MVATETSLACLVGDNEKPILERCGKMMKALKDAKSCTEIPQRFQCRIEGISPDLQRHRAQLHSFSD